MSLNNPLQSSKGVATGPSSSRKSVIGNIPSLPSISPQNFFLQQMETWITSPSNSTQWVLLFESFPKTLKTSVMRELEYTRGEGWNVPYDQLTDYFLHKTIGCFFAQKAEIPRERVNLTYPDSLRGFRGSPISKDRQPHQNLELEFLETNLSFVDGICRPWAALTAHKGLVARPGDESIKTNLTLVQYGRTDAYRSPVARKIWTFFDVCCVGVSKVPYRYKNDSVETRSGVEFAYTNYQVHHTDYQHINPLIAGFTQNGIDSLGDAINVV